MYNFIKNKINRKIFNKYETNIFIPYLLDIQLSSYGQFINSYDSKNYGIERALKSIFPIKNNIFQLNYISYRLVNSLYDIKECINNNNTYNISLIIKLQLIIYKKIGNEIIVKEEEVYFGEIPLMTPQGTFIINGIERVIVSQLNRSPGIYLEYIEKKYLNFTNKNLYKAYIIPYKGFKLNFEFDNKNCLFFRIDSKKKLPITILLKALDYNNTIILKKFYKINNYKIIKDKIFINFLDIEKLNGNKAYFDIKYKKLILIKKGKIITLKDIKRIKEYKINKIEISMKNIIGKKVIEDYLDINGKIIIFANMELNIIKIKKIIKSGYKEIKILYIKNFNYNPYISKTLKIDFTKDKISAIKEIYNIYKISNKINKNNEELKIFFDNLFFNIRNYDLSFIGRMKLNMFLKTNQELNILSKKDIILIIKKIIELRSERKIYSIENLEDIDHLGNKRIKTVGEIIEDQLIIGLLKIENIIKKKFNIISKNKDNNLNQYTPINFINSKVITKTLKDFFCISPLSQFLDQNNPLAEITHKRKITTLGPGGLIRENASIEVRDVHTTHYGRLCPIETPEGPNIGLIYSLSLYAQINKFGFIETPYTYVYNGIITNEIHYLSAIEDNNLIIASANTKKNGYFIDDWIICRSNGEYGYYHKNKVNYVDFSFQQLVSIGASLIPFLEHNDANRALMGSNMQRQALPIISPKSPLIGTGIEKIVARDSGKIILAKRGGLVQYVDAKSIIIKVNNNESNLNDIGIDIYFLNKYMRSNQNTFINQSPCVSLGEYINMGDVLADGQSTYKGELALGQNIRIAFMPWNGYNFEDSILISERLLTKNLFTSIHIYEKICIARETSKGSEEITLDIPNLNDLSISNLDETGIISIGSEVKPGDILVGKITPKGNPPCSPEEKLLYAIFGDHIYDYKDTSLHVPNGIYGKVIDVKIFLKKDNKSIVFNKRNNIIYKKIINKKKYELHLLENGLFSYISDIFLSGGINILLKIPCKKWKNLIHLLDKKKQFEIFRIINNYKLIIYNFNKIINFKKNKINKGDDLSTDILKIVKIYIAVKHNLQLGDKMAGRHGNKGVISKINSIADMPYDENGVPIDIVLNPLGVPSRMNLGQIFETNLGMAAKNIGYIINNLLIKKDIYKIKRFIENIYENLNLSILSNEEILLLAENLKEGLPILTPVFNSVKEKDIKRILKLCNISNTGQIKLFDGRTGIKLERPVTVGYMYILKLNHLINDKMHARSTGSYSLVTQQPLKGKSQFGGQRFGEMEVWALEAYGAAYTLKEILTIKSDDINGRTKMYYNIIKGNNNMIFNIPESFNVLLKEIMSLCINIYAE